MATLATLREKTAQKLGIWKEYTTTAAGETDGSTLVCTSLDFSDDALTDWYVQITLGDTQEIRKIKSNYYSEGQIVPYVAFSAQIAISVTFELFPFDPTDITSKINEAIENAYPYLFNPIIDTTLIGGNILANGNFEDWASSSYPDYWRASVSTLTKESTYKLFGAYGLKVANAGHAYLSSAQYPALMSLEDSDIEFFCHIKTGTASAGRLQVYTKDIDGVETTTSSDYHTGGNLWEQISIEATIPDDLAEIQFRCAVTGANTVYFDNAYCFGNNIDYVLPTSIEYVHSLYTCNDYDELITKDQERIDEWSLINNAGVKYLRIPEASAEKKIEIHGKGRFAALSSDTDTVTLPDPWSRIIATGAAGLLLQSQSNILSSQNKEPIVIAEKYLKEYEALKTMNPIQAYPYQMPKSGVFLTDVDV
jgi:hypothetical protein